MKNIQPLLFFFETFNQWNFHTAIDLFDLKKSKRYANDFHSVHYGLSHPLSKYELYITTKKHTQGIGFMLEDRETQTPKLFSCLQDWETTSVMWPDWMYIPYNSRALVFKDTIPENKPLNFYEMEEDEHFQLLMLRDLPDFDAMKKAYEVYKYLEPIAKKHKMGFSIDYRYMDLDFKDFIPADSAFSTIESLFGNAVELYYEAEEHGNPFSYYSIS